MTKEEEIGFEKLARLIKEGDDIRGEVGGLRSEINELRTDVNRRKTRSFELTGSNSLWQTTESASGWGPNRRRSQPHLD